MSGDDGRDTVPPGGPVGRVSTDSDVKTVIRETTQNPGDLVAFLGADALAVYDDLDDEARQFVDRVRREYRRDLNAAHAPADADTERALKRAAVDQYRESMATMIMLHMTVGGGDIPDGVVEARDRLKDRQHDRLRRLGVFPVDTDTPGDDVDSADAGGGSDDGE